MENYHIYLQIYYITLYDCYVASDFFHIHSARGDIKHFHKFAGPHHVYIYSDTPYFVGVVLDRVHVVPP